MNHTEIHYPQMVKSWNSGEPSQKWPAYQNYFKTISEGMEACFCHWNIYIYIYNNLKFQENNYQEALWRYVIPLSLRSRRWQVSASSDMGHEWVLGTFSFWWNLLAELHGAIISTKQSVHVYCTLVAHWCYHYSTRQQLKNCRPHMLQLRVLFTIR